MKREKGNLFNTIIKHTPDIIFGIFAGSGLMFIVNATITIITTYLPVLQDYFTIMHITLYLFILISTSISFAKGWFRIIYLASSSILLFVYIYREIFGIV